MPAGGVASAFLWAAQRKEVLANPARAVSGRTTWEFTSDHRLAEAMCVWCFMVGGSRIKTTHSLYGEIELSSPTMDRDWGQVKSPSQKCMVQAGTVWSTGARETGGSRDEEESNQL